jgi:hypothetical protein
VRLLNGAARSTELIVRVVLVPDPADLPPHDQPT